MMFSMQEAYNQIIRWWW